MTDLASRLRSFPVRSVTFRFRTLHVVDANGLDGAQLGYSRGPDGEDLAGDLPGDWQATWVVIGHEDQCGDPLFVDTSDSELPVFTAPHGEGAWRPQMIAESLGQFSKALRYLKAVTQGRETPLEFANNPVDDVDAVLEKLGELTACPDEPFWCDWLLGDSIDQ